MLLFGKKNTKIGTVVLLLTTVHDTAKEVAILNRRQWAEEKDARSVTVL